jgi:hypothetical protein
VFLKESAAAFIVTRGHATTALESAVASAPMKV